ncbi:cysteine-rich receptor-like protein kinase 8 [Tanacetum coccineum]
MVSETQSPPLHNSQNTKDINSPHHLLFFHPNDHLGLLLISKKLLGSENYITWRRSMLIAMSAKNKLKLINGEYEEQDPSSELRAYWERANDMILNTISKQIGNNLTFINSAYALWNKLHEHYSQLDGHRIYQLVNEIMDLNSLIVQLRTVNMVVGESSSNAEQGSSQTTLLEPLPIPDESHVYAKMDQL